MFASSARPLLRRQAASLQARSLATSAAPSGFTRIRSGILSTVLVLGTGAFIFYAQDSRAGVHKYVFLPAVGALTANDPEKAHEIAVMAIGSGFAPKDKGIDDERLAIEIWGRKHSNPIGMAAGFDKHGEAIDGLFDLGFGYVEIGSVTPEAQPGNPKPRVFRIPESNALVNRYGFNSEGHLSVISRLRSRVRKFVAANALYLPTSIFPLPPANALPSHDVVAQLLASPAGADALVVDAVGTPRSLRAGKVLAINLGKNKVSSAESIDDFVNGVHAMGPYADILVVNVSSPNTPGLRDLQKKEILEELLAGVVKARNGLKGEFKPPVLVKVAPDLDEAQLKDIAEAVLATGIDGIIVSNTTITRPSSAGNASELLQAGGLSGPPVKPLALAALSALHSATEGKIPLIGCGGISNGADAIEFAKAGATLVQMYTSFIYEGVGLPRKLKDEITEILKREGTTWKQIIGTAVPVPKVKFIEPTPIVEIIEPIVEEKSVLRLELESLLEDLSASDHDASVDVPATEAEILAVVVPAFEEGNKEIIITPSTTTEDSLPPATVTAEPSVVLVALATTVIPPTVVVDETSLPVPTIEVAAVVVEKEDKKEENSEKRWV